MDITFSFLKTIGFGGSRSNAVIESHGHQVKLWPCMMSDPCLWELTIDGLHWPRLIGTQKQIRSVIRMCFLKKDEQIIGRPR